MPWDLFFLIIAALLLFADGTRLVVGKYGLQSLAFGFIVLAAIVWRY